MAVVKVNKWIARFFYALLPDFLLFFIQRHVVMGRDEPGGWDSMILFAATTWTLLLFARLALTNPSNTEDHGQTRAYFAPIVMNQAPIHIGGNWEIELQKNWDVLGPFPLHAREQHFLGPNYPFKDNEIPIVNSTTQYVSSLADGGLVKWNTTVADDEGNLQIKFPEIRWAALRASEGWAVLQHHALLHTELTVSSKSSSVDTGLCLLEVNVQQASFFRICPRSTGSSCNSNWYKGNIYALPNTPTHLIPLSKGTYDVYAAGDYEIRLFGDPLEVKGGDLPVQRLRVQFGMSQTLGHVVLEPQLNVIPEFVDGWAFGDAAGIGVKVLDGWWDVASVGVESMIKGQLEAQLLTTTRLAPLQSRIVPIRFSQQQALSNLIDSVTVTLSLKSQSSDTVSISVNLDIIHRDSWANNLSSNIDAYKGTYFLGSTPFAFMAKPPKTPSPSTPCVLVLHGAGVEVTNPLWPQAVKRQEKSWVIFHSGRTAWGFDWHGTSTLEVWKSYEAFKETLRKHQDWRDWEIRTNKILMIGHSNGGQGTWYIAERWPDKVFAAIPAAGYTKSQLYVSIHLSHSAHYMDHALRHVLESALMPDDNDIHASNMVDTKLLAIHGGNDGNVPVWHSRGLMGAVKEWYPNHGIKLFEDPGKPHWYDEVLQNDRVQSFLDENLLKDTSNVLSLESDTFTLTVTTPQESGSLRGFRILQVSTPGKLSRLSVTISDGGDGSCTYGCSKQVTVKARNVLQFSITAEVVRHLRLNNVKVSIEGGFFDLGQASGSEDIYITRTKFGVWTVSSAQHLFLRLHGPMHQILSTPQPLLFIISSTSPLKDAYFQSALSLSHDLLSYLRIDVEIIFTDELKQDFERIKGRNVVLFGGGVFTDGLEEVTWLPRNLGWVIHGATFQGPNLGFATLAPHPLSPSTNLVMHVLATSTIGLNRIANLFPIRTGVAVPEWIVVDADSEVPGNNVLAAGWWNNEWGWNEIMSYIGDF